MDGLFARERFVYVMKNKYAIYQRTFPFYFNSLWAVMMCLLFKELIKLTRSYAGP